MYAPNHSEEAGPTSGRGLSRRTLLRGGVLSVAGLVATQRLDALSRVQSLFSGDTTRDGTSAVPAAAYVRRWGLAPAGPCETLGDSECRTGVPTGLRTTIGGLSVPGLGIPLGGVGAGVVPLQPVRDIRTLEHGRLAVVELLGDAHAPPSGVPHPRGTSTARREARPSRPSRPRTTTSRRSATSAACFRRGTS